MTAKAAYSTPMFHVADIRRSIRFYERLGFETVDIEGDAVCPVWGRLHCEGGAIMLLLAEEPVDPAFQNVLLYMYTPDLSGLREQLVAAGLTVPPINYPEHMQSGELHLRDPDGYPVLIGHWGDAEHGAWLERIKVKKESGALIPPP